MFGILSSYDSTCNSCLIIGFKQNGVSTEESLPTAIYISLMFCLYQEKDSKILRKEKEKKNFFSVNSALFFSFLFLQLTDFEF